ncbi:Spo0E like sporulation regulatory protein [compost metagenome]
MMAYPALGNLSRTSSRQKISSELLVTIEDLRNELMNAAGNENFNSDTVLELSQRLDKYIVQAQIQMLGR